MKTTKNHTALLGSLLAVFIFGSTGCEYATTKPHALQAKPTEQKSEEENVRPQATPVQDETAKKIQELKGQLVGENETLPAEPEKAKAEPAPAETPKPEETYFVKPVYSATPEPEQTRVLLPRTEELSAALPNDAPKETLAFGDSSVTLEAVGGDSGNETEMSCDENQAITYITAGGNGFGEIGRLGRIGCTDINRLASGTANSHETLKEFGGSPWDGGWTASPVPALRFAFTGYAVIACHETDQGPLVVCGMRAFAKPVTTDKGVLDDPVWLGVAMGENNANEGPQSIFDDEKLRDAVTNHTNAWIDQDTYVANCPTGYVLTGFKGRTGDLVDQLAGVCKQVIVQ